MPKCSHLRLIFAALALILVLTTALPVQSSAIKTEAGYEPTDSQVRFEHLLVEDGLSHSTVLAVMQDAQGFMWFGTQDGLSRYDGYEFTIFHHDEQDPNSISGNNLFSMCLDDEGILWVGTDGGGLNRFDPLTESFTAYRYDEEDEHSISSDSIWALAVDHEGYIWAGSPNNGLSRFDPKSETFKRYLPDEDDPHSISHVSIYSLYVDSEGTLWAGARDGLNRYDSETDTFSVYTADPEDPNALSNGQVWSIFEDSQGYLWIGTRYGGLNRFDRQSGTFVSYQHDPQDPYSLSDNMVWDVMEDSRGFLWVATANGGLNYFDRQQERFIHFRHNPNNPHSVSSDDLFDVFEDNSGTLWISSRRRGVNKLYSALQRFKLYRRVPEDENSLSSNIVHAVWKSPDETLWVGTVGGGLNRFNPDDTATHYMSDPNDPESPNIDSVYALYQDPDGYMWIGTVGGGLHRMDPQSEEVVSYNYDPEDPNTISSNYITVLAPAPDDKLWVGTLGLGLNLLDPQSGEVIRLANDPEDPDSLSEDTVYALVNDPDGSLWVGTARQGLDKLDPETMTFSHYPANPAAPLSLVNNTVHALYQDDDGTLWVGTASGLSRSLPDSNGFRNYTINDGLPHNTIYGLLGDSDGGIWISTGNGIARFDPVDETFMTFDMADGLQSSQFNQFAYYQGSDGTLYFGGPEGLNEFQPDNMSFNTTIPPVVFTGLKIFNQPVLPGSEILPQPINMADEIVLEYDQSMLTIEFAALNYQVTVHNKYQYKLEGFDADWSPWSTERSATYTNLDPKIYTFMVRASNNDGIWDEAAHTLTLRVLPPWWMTWWFRLLLGLSVAGVAVLGIRWRLRTMRQRSQQLEANNRLLEKTVAERTVELQTNLEKLKKEIAERETAQKSMISVQKMAGIGTLAAGVAHEINSPLQVITGLCARLLKDFKQKQADTQEVIKDIESIESNAWKVAQIIRSLLTYSRPEMSFFETHTLANIVEDSLLLIEHQLYSSPGIELHKDLDQDAPPLKCDQSKISQIVISLLNNACDALPPGGGKITVRTAHDPQVHQHILQVCDNGHGIQPDILPHIFEPFFTTREIGSGVGLGLASVYGIIQAHGGQIEVESEPHQLTCFTIHLPEDPPQPVTQPETTDRYR